MKEHKIYAMAFSKVYEAYVAKAERKGRTREEVHEILFWLTGYDEVGLKAQLDAGQTVEGFFTAAPKLQPHRDLVKGVVCGVRVENLEPSTMREIRIADKLIDELAKGKAMGKILREPKL